MAILLNVIPLFCVHLHYFLCTQQHHYSGIPEWYIRYQVPQVEGITFAWYYTVPVLYLYRVRG